MRIGTLKFLNKKEQQIRKYVIIISVFGYFKGLIIRVSIRRPNMTMSTDNLQMGINVDIQRTDGRVHSAVVSGINLDAKSVTVEWFERGETKGKEIELEAVLELNPDILQQTQPSQNILEPKRTHNVMMDSQPTATKDTARRNPTKSARQSYLRNPNNERNANNRINGIENIPEQPPPKKQPVAAPVQSAAAVAAAAAADAAARRKSNCVKEVERIKLRRDERRAQHHAIREHIEQEVDTSNPNWQFELMIREYQDSLDFTPITNTDVIENHQICVCVRKRPLNKKENAKKEVDVTTVPNKGNVVIHEPKLKVDLTKYVEHQNFRYDYAFDENTSNDIVYRFTAKPLVESIFEKGMATCFAYGQTGSGKTHTMGGDFSSKGQQDCSKGIYALAGQDVFKLLNTKYKKADLLASASFFEIYSGKVFDLLNRKIKLRVLEDGKQVIQIVGLKEEPVTCPEDILRLIQNGNNVRTSGVTSANNHSSRSHAVFQIVLRKKGTRKLHGKFSLIDLAGNERGADTSSADRQTRMEGAEINKSLLALKECIRALGRRGAHLPFRASKLTQVLRDSFIGEKSRTCMIAMISPGMGCCEHTLNTLRYADRVKELGPGGPVENRPAVICPPPASCALSPQNSDLCMLRANNDEGMSEELLTFHEVVNHMQEAEEDIIDEHRNLIEQNEDWLDNNKKIFKATDNVDYDVEEYLKQLELMLAQKMQEVEHVKNLRDSVAMLRKEITDEENLSAHRRPPYK